MYQNMDGIVVFGEHDEATLAQMKRIAADEQVTRAVLCADGHKGYSMPIGGVAAYRNAVSPSGVGYDISCGNKAARTDIRADDLRPHIKSLMDQIAQTVVFGVGRSSGKAVDHELFDDPTWNDLRDVGKLKQQARQQLGTVGSGNHYVDLFEDEVGWVWVGVHFGSRGLGHRTASGFLNLAAGRAFDAKAPGEHMDQPATMLSLNTELGQAYWQAMTLAGRYAYAGRDFVVNQVLEILGAHAVDEVHNHHNYAWSEQHNGEEVIVVRKGATPAWPGQRGFIGGSMGDISVIVEGVASDEARAGAAQHRARRGPRDEPHKGGGQKEVAARSPDRQEGADRGCARCGQPGDDARVAAQRWRRAARRWVGRKPARVPPLARSAPSARRLDPGAAYAQAAGRRDGG